MNTGLFSVDEDKIAYYCLAEDSWKFDASGDRSMEGVPHGSA
jgi:hypothetical protein